MSISPFFHALGSAYQAEMDDLTFDSEGKDVLRQRLAEKRKELPFLRQMIEISPEMVAVVFNQAFQFKLSAVMEDLVSRESDELPDWDRLADVIVLRPWANELANEILKEPMGEWLMTVAAGLEYLYAKPGKPLAAAQNADDEDEGDNEDGDNGHDQDQSDDPRGDPDDADGESGARRREDAAEDWMEAQGFDRKTR
jgi:hypothetical protein